VLTDRSDRNDPIEARPSDHEDDATDRQLFTRGDLDADPTPITLQVRSERLTRRLERVWQALERLPVLVHRGRTEEIRADVYSALKTAEELVLTTRAVAADICLAGAETASRESCSIGPERLRVIIQHHDRTTDEYGQPGCPLHVAEQLELLRARDGATILLDGAEQACSETIRRTLAAYRGRDEGLPDWLASYAARHPAGSIPG
jgi:hypothetical protein